MGGGEDLVGQLVLRPAGKLRGRLPSFPPSFPVSPPEPVEIPKFGTKFPGLFMFVSLFFQLMQTYGWAKKRLEKNPNIANHGEPRGALPLALSHSVHLPVSQRKQSPHFSDDISSERAGLQLRERRGGSTGMGK